MAETLEMLVRCPCCGQPMNRDHRPRLDGAFYECPYCWAWADDSTLALPTEEGDCG